jgi:hypothetical protein
VFEIIACCMELDELFASRCLAGTRVCSQVYCTRGCAHGSVAPAGAPVGLAGADVIQYLTRVVGTGTGLLFSGGYRFMKPIPMGFAPVAIPML